MIAVCLLTCGREDLSSRTVVSFREHNRGRPDLILLHADAGGADPIRSRVIAINGAFRTVHSPAERVPQMTSYRHLIEEAAIAGAEFLLWLENDWESVAPIPTLDELRKYGDAGAVCFRMYGKRKMRGDGPRAMAGEHRIGTDVKIDWLPTADPKWEAGLAHWGGGGCIATLTHLESQYHRKRLKDVITAKNDLPSLRMTENVLWHIGEQTTEGFQG